MIAGPPCFDRFVPELTKVRRPGRSAAPGLFFVLVINLYVIFDQLDIVDWGGGLGDPGGRETSSDSSASLSGFGPVGHSLLNASLGCRFSVDKFCRHGLSLQAAMSFKYWVSPPPSTYPSYSLVCRVGGQGQLWISSTGSHTPPFRTSISAVRYCSMCTLCGTVPSRSNVRCAGSAGVALAGQEVRGSS